jgi:hypothetical protein
VGRANSGDLAGNWSRWGSAGSEPAAELGTLGGGLAGLNAARLMFSLRGGEDARKREQEAGQEVGV